MCKKTITTKDITNIMDELDTLLSTHKFTLCLPSDKEEYERSQQEEGNTAAIYGDIYYQIEDLLKQHLLPQKKSPRSSAEACAHENNLELVHSIDIPFENIPKECLKESSNNYTLNAVIEWVELFTGANGAHLPIALTRNGKPRTSEEIQDEILEKWNQYCHDHGMDETAIAGIWWK